MASSYDAFRDLDLTRDDVDKIGEALKNKEFRKMLVEYVDEIRDPENRKIYEKEVIELEKERGQDVTFLNPTAGYVVKTSANGNKKAFINICGNENVQKPTSQCKVQDGAKGLQWTLPHCVTPPRDDFDNKRVRCVVFDVIFHPDTLHLAHKNKAFKDMVNNTACDAIESHFEYKLDRKNLKFPKLQYKGYPSNSIIRTPSTEKQREKSKEEQEFLDQIFSHIPVPDRPKSPKKQKKVQTKDNTNETSSYTTPKYVIKHRSHVELEEFTFHKNAKLNTAIPKELVLEVNLPLLKAASDLVLDVTAKTVSISSEKPAKYKLNLTLPYEVHQDCGNAKFEKDTKKLLITLPVKRNQRIFACDLEEEIKNGMTFLLQKTFF